MTPATCPNHPGVPASATCSRCGTFACDRCLNAERLCSACISRTLTGLTDLGLPAVVAQVTLGTLAFAHLASGIAGVLPLESKTMLVVVQGLAGLFELAMLVFGAIAFWVWFYVAAERTQALGGDISGSPASALGSWFIPLVNMVHPFRVVRGMLATAGAHSDLVTFWQLTWCGGVIASWVWGRMGETDPGVELCWQLLSAASLVSCVIIIRRVGRLDSVFTRGAPAG